jgi:hypothetical protein
MRGPHSFIKLTEVQGLLPKQNGMLDYFLLDLLASCTSAVPLPMVALAFTQLIAADYFLQPSS